MLQVGKEGCKKGVCTLHVNNEDMTVEFQHLGIQCVRKKDIEESLKQRSDIRGDPFKQGFKHVENPSSIDLNAVRLCFQVRNDQTHIVLILTLLHYWTAGLLGGCQDREVHSSHQPSLLDQHI